MGQQVLGWVVQTITSRWLGCVGSSCGAGRWGELSCTLSHKAWRVES